MDIYDESGELDFDKTRASLGATGGIHSEAERRRRYAEIQIATMLDIAGSLRILALEAGAAMGMVAEVEPIAEEEVTDETRDFLVIGDLVTVIGDTVPGEVVSLGFDQGEMYANVAFAEGRRERFYVRNLERLVGDRGPQNPEAGLGLVGTVGVEDAVDALRYPPGGASELVSDAEEAADPDLTDLADDIDADFDGDHHPGADDALERLKANEATRKASKKKGGKK